MAPPDTAGPPLRSLPRGLVLLVVAALAACSDLTGVEELRSEFTPSAAFETLWTGLEACSGREADFERVRWFWIRRFPDERRVLGQWNERHEITLSSAVMRNGAVVAHEMLHDLLDGDRGHRHPAWDTCGVPRGGG